MKSHEQKMAEKAAHEAELERNDLNAWLRNTWARIESGQVLSRRCAMIALLSAWRLGPRHLLLRGPRRRREPRPGSRWKRRQASSPTTSKSSPQQPGQPAGLAWPACTGPAEARPARHQPAFADQRRHPRQSASRASRTPARSSLKLADEFKDDLTLQAQAIDGAAHAELALVGIPKTVRRWPSADYRGTVDKAIELFRRYAKLAGDTAGAPAKKMADELEAKKQDVAALGMLSEHEADPGRCRSRRSS